MIDETELDDEFKKEFKLTFIKSIELGHSINNIKKELREQSYPSDIIERLVEELESDEDVMDVLRKEKKPSLLDIIRKKLFKLSEEQKIKRVVKIHSIFYNLLINTKRRFNEVWKEINNILENPEDKKLPVYYAKMQESWINDVHNTVHKIRDMAKTLMGEDIKQEIKNKVNNILDVVEKEEEGLDEEILNLKQIKVSVDSPDKIKEIIKIEKEKLKQKEHALQKIMDKLSEESPKFREIISQL